MVIAFVVGFTIINLSLWAVLLIKFKKVFSADNIIEKYRGIMNKMVADLNRNAENDINLSKEATKRMKQMLNEADKTMENFREATDRLRDMIAEVDKYSTINNGESVVKVNLKQYSNKTEQIFDNTNEYETSSTSVFRNGSRYNITAYQNNSFSEETDSIDPNAAYEISIGSTNNRNANKNSTLLKDETIVTPQGAAYKEVPVLTTKLYDEPKQVYNGKVTLNEKVQKLFNKGLSASEIAAKLSCSVTEVQLIIELIS